MIIIISRKNNKNTSLIRFYVLYNLAVTHQIEIVEDDSEPVDEHDMSFLNDVLEQYQQTLYHQGLLARMLNTRTVAVGFVRMAFELSLSRFSFSWLFSTHFE